MDLEKLKNNEKSEYVTIEVTKEVRNALKDICKKNNLSMRKVVNEIMKEFIKENQ